MKFLLEKNRTEQNKIFINLEKKNMEHFTGLHVYMWREVMFTHAD